MKRCRCGAMMILATSGGLRACWYCDQGERSELDLDWIINGVKAPYDGQAEMGEDW